MITTVIGTVDANCETKPDGKRETMSPDEAARALHEAQVEFWESKSGQLQLRKGAERTFPEFISRVPAKLLTESGLKRHYKDPEALKVLRKAPVN